jgi:hypothetical protein
MRERTSGPNLFCARDRNLFHLDYAQLDHCPDWAVAVEQLHVGLSGAVCLTGLVSDSRERRSLQDGPAKVVDMDWRVRC